MLEKIFPIASIQMELGISVAVEQMFLFSPSLNEGLCDLEVEAK